uniref:Protein kinase domain-containing protein n=1 Tax=Rhabditophanes sp. KR3021 TaxID=114890 RepID=A0AC35TUA4_9BILA
MNFEDKDLADEDFSEIDSLCFYTTGEESIGDDLLSHYSIDDNVDGKRHLTGVEEDYYSFLLEKDLSPIKATFTDDNISCEYSETISVPPYQHSELYMTLNYEDPATTLKMIKRTYTHDKNAAFIDGQNFLKSMRLKFDADFFVDELQQRAISCYSALAIAHYFLVRDILPVIVYPDHMLDRKVFHFSPSTMKLYEVI